MRKLVNLFALFFSLMAAGCAAYVSEKPRTPSTCQEWREATFTINRCVFGDAVCYVAVPVGLPLSSRPPSIHCLDRGF